MAGALDDWKLAAQPKADDAKADYEALVVEVQVAEKEHDPFKAKIEPLLLSTENLERDAEKARKEELEAKAGLKGLDRRSPIEAYGLQQTAREATNKRLKAEYDADVQKEDLEKARKESDPAKRKLEAAIRRRDEAWERWTNLIRNFK